MHFHLAALDIGGDTCTARLMPEFWDRGEHFTEDSTMTGELHLYAHFEVKSARDSEPTARADAGCPDFVSPTLDLETFDANAGLLDTQLLDSELLGSQSLGSQSLNTQPLGMQPVRLLENAITAIGH